MDNKSNFSLWTEEMELLLDILRVALDGSELSETIKSNIDQATALELYRLAKKHDLAHILSYVLYKNGITVEGELAANLKKIEIMSIYRVERIKHTYAKICSVFDENGIDYIPLKGSVIRPYYPIDSMRTSCDIDILIHEEDIDKAINVLEDTGFKFGKRNYHDVSGFSETKVHLELHFSIQENLENLDSVLKTAWDHAVPIKGNMYAFTKEFWVFHMYAHMSYHFLSGGCGIRSLLDIWIMKNKMDCPYFEAETLLKQAGIYVFAKEMDELVSVCFSSEQKDDFHRALLLYIWSGGVYGTLENSIAASNKKQPSATKYVFKRVFLPYKAMVISYPILKKAPFLLPFCWVIRFVKALFNKKSKKIRTELSVVSNVSDEKIDSISYLRNRLGL